jgi:hypothetical protein
MPVCFNTERAVCVPTPAGWGETESQVFEMIGGGGSQQRTRLCVEFPDMQGINREFLQNQALQTQSSARKPRQSQDFF